MQHSSAEAARVNVEQKTIAGDSQWASVRANAADRERERGGGKERRREPIDGHKFHLARRRVRAAQRQTEALLTPSTLLLQSAALDACVSSVGVQQGGEVGGGSKHIHNNYKRCSNIWAFN